MLPFVVAPVVASFVARCAKMTRLHHISQLVAVRIVVPQKKKIEVLPMTRAGGL